MLKRMGQISIEYLVVIAFVSVLVMSVLGIAYFYSSGVKDRVTFYHLEAFAGKVISSSESIFYSGSPSKAVINAYMPAGVKSVQVAGENIVFEVSTSSGVSRIAYGSKVPLTGMISSSEGVQVINLTAEEFGVLISRG